MKIEINIENQVLSTLKNDKICAKFDISSALHGCGQKQGSYQTPLGSHQISEKIGAGAPIYSVFQARQLTGEIYTPELAVQYPERDWVLTRILWLQGLEPGVNQGGDVDSHARFIYIHGTNEENKIGVPASHGCIRMRNADVIDLFEQVDVGTDVLIA